MRIETDLIRQTARFLNLGYSQREISKQIKIHRSSIKIIREKLQLFPIRNDELILFTDHELFAYSYSIGHPVAPSTGHRFFLYLDT